MAKRANKRKDKRSLVALLLLLLAIAIIIGISLAFFSDYVTLPFAGTAGTLGIDVEEGDSTQYWTTADMLGVVTVESDDFNPENMNPGDYVLLTYDVTSLGSKSAWIKAEINLADYNATTNPNGFKIEYDAKNTNTAPLDTAVKSAFTLYALPEFPTTGTTVYATLEDLMEGLAKGENTAIAELVAVTSTSDPNAILNGLDETETLGENTVTLQYVLAFDKTVGNDFQGIKVSFGIDVKAMQYRNNVNPTWTTVPAANYTF